MYGDLLRTIPTQTRLARIREATDPTARLLEAGELAQGLIDAELGGRDVLTPLHRAALDLVRAVAAKQPLPSLPSPPDVVTSKVPEGFAFYAVDPELYARAARPYTNEKTIVIGIRTIGVTLGAAVAAATNAHDFISVRPTGHPFRRRIELDYDVDPDATYLIVDEGPGLSGSSFHCVGDWLEARGAQRIVLFPSHDNPLGPQADPRHAERWQRATKAYVPFDELWPELVRDFESVIGPIESHRDLGAGAWRSLVGSNAPVWTNRERRKYLVRASGRDWLIKFAGLAHHGSEKLPKAQRLAARKLTPPVVDFVRGFLIYEWMDGRVADLRRDRAALLDFAARYLEALQDEEEGDSRMHPWEWIVTRDGIRKCDAVDHTRAHDGLGPQPLSWDVAGASIELELSDDEERALRNRLGIFDDDRARYAETQEQIFRQGASEAWDAEESARLSSRADWYSQCAAKLSTSASVLAKSP